MTQLEEYRLKRLVPQLRKLAKQYPMRTLENVIRNIEDRLAFNKPNNSKNNEKT